MKITKSELKDIIKESLKDYVYNNAINFIDNEVGFIKMESVALEAEIENFNKLVSLTENTYICEAIDTTKIKEKFKAIVEKIKNLWNKFISFIKSIPAKISGLINKNKQVDEVAVKRFEKAMRNAQLSHKESAIYENEEGSKNNMFGLFKDLHIDTRTIVDMKDRRYKIIMEYFNNANGFCSSISKYNYDISNLVSGFDHYIENYNASTEKFKQELKDLNNKLSTSLSDENIKSYVSYTSDPKEAIEYNKKILEEINKNCSTLKESSAADNILEKTKKIIEEQISDIVLDRDKAENEGNESKMRFCEKTIMLLEEFSNILYNNITQITTLSSSNVYKQLNRYHSAVILEIDRGTKILEGTSTEE